MKIDVGSINPYSKLSSKFIARFQGQEKKKSITKPPYTIRHEPKDFYTSYACRFHEEVQIIENFNRGTTIDTLAQQVKNGVLTTLLTGSRTYLVAYPILLQHAQV